jgi:pyruvate formate lyase activating enzyme
VITCDDLHNKGIRHFFREKFPVLSAGMTGCNLSCAFCENESISQTKSSPCSQAFVVEELISLALSKGRRGICMSHNEPMVAFEDLLRLCEECHRQGLAFFLKTNAYVNARPWREICGEVNAVNVDWKGLAPDYEEICGASEYVIEDRIREAHDMGIHIEISIPVYPSKDQESKWRYMAKFLAGEAPQIPVHLFSIQPARRWIHHEVISSDIVHRAKKIFEQYLIFVDLL